MPISMGIITSQKISPSCCLFIYHGLGCQPSHNDTLPVIFVDILVIVYQIAPLLHTRNIPTNCTRRLI